MSDDLKIQGEVSLDTTNVDQALVKVEKGATRMADAVVVAGKKAGQGLADVEKGFTGIGAGGDTSSAKVERSTKSIISSIQRTSVQMEAGGKVGSRYYEILANQRGIPADALRPYLDQLRKIEQAQSSVGVSAAQTAAAMRNVPAQFTDIITSLQGGQAPLTVLLQQGGQLKDMFGGVGNAAKAMGSYVLSLISPVTLTAAAVGGLAYVYSQANSEAKEFSKALITSNSAAGYSVDALRSLSTNIEAVGASSRAVANESLLSLVSAGNIASGMIEKAALASVRAQTMMSKAVADTASEFSDLGKSPTAAVEKLNEKYRFLTLEIYEQIKAYEDQGKVADAAKLAQNSYADSLISQSEKVKATLTDWERGWLRIKNATSGAFGSVLTMFDDPTNDQKIAKLFKERDKLEESQKNLAGDNSFLNRGQAQRVQALLDQNKAEINAIREKIKAKNDEAKAEEEKNKRVAAGIQWSSIVEKNLDKQAKLELEITKTRQLGIAAGKSSAEIEKEIATIRKNGTEKTKKAIEDQSLAWQVYKVNVEAAGSAEKRVLDDIQKSIASLKFSNPLKEITAEFEKQNAAFVKINAGLDEYAIGLQGQNELAQMELSLIGQSATERGILIEQYKIELGLQKEIRKIKAEIKDADAAQILIDKATSNANVEKSQVALKVQQQEWTKFYGDIYSGLTDSLYRGFEAGKGFFQSFWDGIKNLFKTTVLKLAVQGVMTGVLGLGAAGQAGAAQTNPLGQVMSAFSSGNSLLQGFSAAGTAFSSSLATGIGELGATMGSEFMLSVSSMMQGGAASGAAGTVAGGLTSAATAMPYVAAAVAAFQGMKAINGEYRLGGLSADVGAALGILPRLFGRKAPELQQSELSGTVGASGFSATTRDVYMAKGGLFRSDKWSETKTPFADTTGLSAQYEAIKAVASSYASLLGLSTDALASFSKSFTFNLSKTGDAAKDAEANQKLINDLFVGITNDVSTLLAPSIATFAKSGETASQTLQRLAMGLTDVNAVMRSVGFVEFAKSLEGSNAAARLAELTGGIEKLSTGAQYFFENFLSEAEKIKPSADLVASTMKKLGQSSVDTVDEFKQLVQGLDLSTQAGAEMYAQLIAIAPQFKAVADFAKQGVDEVRKAEEEKAKIVLKGNVERAALLADRRAADSAQEAIKKASDDAFKTLTESVTSGMQSMLRAGNVGAALAAQMSITSFNPAQYTDGGGFNAGAFNRNYAFAKANAAKGLMNTVSADALNVQDVSKVMQDLIATVFDEAIVASNKSNLLDQLKLPASDVIRTAMNGLLDAGIESFMIETSVGRGAGLASVIGAELDYMYASFDGIGRDVVEYTKFVDGLGWSLDKGKISQSDYAAALDAANKVLGASIDLIGNEAAQRERIVSSQKALNEAGLSSVSFYFNQIGKSVQALNDAASQSSAPLAQVTAGIGRLTSLSDVFMQSSRAALSGGANLGNGSLINAQVVAEAAAKAAAIMTTADAAQAAKLLAGSVSFSGVGGAQLRDISLMLDGVKAFDSVSFEASFMRMNDALNKGNITQEQYQDIFSTSLKLYQGIADQQEKELEARSNFVDQLGTISGAMKDFYNTLLVDPNKSPLSKSARMKEVMSLYDDAKMGLLAGNASRVNDFKLYGEQIANAANYSSRAEASYGYSRVLSDAQVLSRYTDQDPNASQVKAIQSLEKSISEKLELQFVIMRSQLDELQKARLSAARQTLPKPEVLA